jgi:putative ABC transport system permease protein
MLKNYLKTAWRHIVKNKGFSVLNIVGLSMGLACAILILLWIQDEVSYNKFNKKYSVLYQVMENHDYDGKIYTFAATPGPLAASMKADFPEVLHTARMGWGDRWLFDQGDKPLYENGNYVDAEFFEMFSFDFIYGNAKQPLPDQHAMVITEKLSKKIYGEKNPVGTYLRVNDKTEFLVTAVVKDPPLNSSVKFEWLVSFKNFEEQNQWWTKWGFNGMQTFAELKPLTSLASFNRKFCKYIKSKESDASGEPLLLPMKDWRLRNNFEHGKQIGGRIEYVKLFGIIAVLLVVIACINFMNLATARSEQRAKEVGVRKVMGAQRSALMTQFIGESMVMAFFSLLGACILVVTFLPLFNDLVGKQLTLGMDRPLQWLIFLGIAAVCGLLAGSYPSIFLSAFKPISIFRGNTQGKNSRTVLIRKGLVITQFVISIVLIISTVVIYKQIQHVKSRQLGFNKDKLLYVSQKGRINEKLEVIYDDLMKTGVVAHAATCNQRVLQMGNNTGGFHWQGMDPKADVLITTEFVSPDYLKTTGMELLSGRSFYSNAKSDSLSVLVNETLAKIMGGGKALNQQIWQDSTKYTIVGVVKDFVYNSMYNRPDPVIMYCDPHATSYYFVRLDENAEMESALKKVETVFKRHNPGYPFEYNFLDADFDNQFRSEMLVSKLSRLFAIITIIVSCLGLFGLAAYTAERRTKEIGIRKVLGASLQNVVSLLSKDFLKLVVIALLIASPLAWYLMNNWLQEYSYRISVQWWMFAAAGAASIFIALFTVSFQALKAAIANPVKSLRTE